MSNTLLLIDGHSLAYRAFFGLPPTITLPTGQPINAVYGFTTLLFNILEKYSPEYICVCFDRKEDTFRHEMYADYKAHRQPPPQEFIQQIPILKEMLTRLAVPTLEKAGYEADDLIGTLSRKAEEEGMRAVIITGDKDSLQLASEKTLVIVNQRGMSDVTEYTPEKIMTRYQLTPAQIVDLKALQGDTSDNIPGVAGIGEKTAIGLLTQYHSVKNIFEQLDTVPSKSVRDKLEAGKENAFLSYQLAKIDRAVPITRQMADFRYVPDWSKVLDCFSEYRFSSLIRKYQSHFDTLPAETQKTVGPSEPDGTYVLLQHVAEVEGILEALKNGFAIDLETTGIDAMTARLVGIALSIGGNAAWYIPLNSYLDPEALSPVGDDDQDQGTLFQAAVPQAERKTRAEWWASNPILDVLKPILEDESVPKYTHNGKYEYMVLHHYGITLRGIAFDTLLAAYLAFPGEKLGLKDLVLRHFNIRMTTFEEVAGKGKQQIPFDQVPLDQACRYAGADADCTWRLMEILIPKIKELELENLYYKIELPLQIVLAKMEIAGIAVDTLFLKALDTEFDKRLEQVRQEIYQLAGEHFNINSTRQLAEVLFDKLKLPVIKRTKTARSTDSFVLEKLRNDYEIAEKLLEYRTIDKLQNTYVRSLPTLVNPFTGHIHTSYAQTIAITGRLSSNNPNLQNIPIRTEEGRKIRGAFIPSPRNLIVSADYSQIELRVLAHLSQDPNMLAAFRNKEDVHASTAAIVFGVPLEEVTKEQRYKAKAVNFGIIYGQSAFGLAEGLNISRAEAKEIIDNYFKQFPSIRVLIESTIEDARKTGLVKTEFGRIRPIPEINAQNASLRNFAERIAVNTRMQGTAADIIKIAMINLQAEMEARRYQSKMVLQVHDELVFDMVASEQDQLLPLIREKMEGAVSFSVPFSVDISVGENWLEVS